MTEKLQVANVPEEKAATTVDRAAMLKSLAGKVRSDSVQQSDEYLNETTVPHGGE